MNKKANLKKLQLPKIQRTTRSSKNTEISNFFVQPSAEQDEETVPTPTEPAEQIKRKSRKKLSNFLTKDTSSNLEHDFEIPNKPTKKAPVSSQITKKPAKRKKQTTLKSAFLKSEEHFFEIIAQHAIVDEFNPDEMQIALALSKSEVETNGVVEVDGRSDIRSQLQKYGFRTGSSEKDYDISILNLAQKKKKWANKFTALTLRNPEMQQKKLNKKVEIFLSEQVQSIPLSTGHLDSVQVFSTILKEYLPAKSTVNFLETELEITSIDEYYVLELFKPTTVKVGHLLRDCRKIAGRDLSPVKSVNDEDLNLTQFLTCPEYITQNLEVKEIEEPVQHVEIPHISVNTVQIVDDDETIQTPCIEIPLSNDDHIIQSPVVKKAKLSYLTPVKSIEKLTCAPTSPDLFADSDAESVNDDIMITEQVQTEPHMDVETIQVPTDEKQDLFADSNAESVNNDFMIIEADKTHMDVETIQQSTDDNQYLVTDSDTESVKNDCMIVEEEKIKSVQVESHMDVETIQIPTEEKEIEMDGEITIFEKYSSDDVKTFGENLSLALKESDAEFIDLTQDGLEDVKDDSSISQVNTLQHTKEHSLESKLIQDDIINNSVNTTQEDSYGGDCIVLSDDEVNYSIRKSFYKPHESKSNIDLTMSSSESDNEENPLNFSILDLVQEDEAFSEHMHSVETSFTVNEALDQIEIDCPESLNTQTLNGSLTESPNKSSEFRKNITNESRFELEKLMTKYGLIEKKASPKVFKTPLKIIHSNERKVRKSLSQSFDLTNKSLKDNKINSSYRAQSLSPTEWSELTFKGSLNSPLKTSICHPIDIDLTLSPPTMDSEDTFKSDELVENKSSPHIVKTPSGEKESKKVRKSLSQAFYSSHRGLNKSFSQTDDYDNFNISLCREEVTPSTPSDQILDSNHLNQSVAYNDTFELSSLRAEYGISPLPKTQSESALLHQHPRKSIQKFRSSRKFAKFTKSNEEEEKDGNFSDFDDIDKLIFGSPVKKLYKKPEGLDELLTANIIPNSPSPKKPTEPIEFEYNSKVFLIRTENVPPKPDFERMDSPTRLKQLHKFGLKPLKRKQAVIMLEYIYNQTHPFVIDREEAQNFVNCDIPTTSSTGTIEVDLNSKGNRFNLQDTYAGQMLSDDGRVPDIFSEWYIFQTNVSKKISTALLPFHIAWFNLIKSHPKLHEAVLFYEPIDLQEIYLFLKGIGYRYEPKDMKKFFDSRCIIFQYDLSDSRNNRNIRKHNKNKKKTTLSQK